MTMDDLWQKFRPDVPGVTNQVQKRRRHIRTWYWYGILDHGYNSCDEVQTTFRRQTD
jgi:hypothetical protein